MDTLEIPMRSSQRCDERTLVTGVVFIDFRQRKQNPRRTVSHRPVLCPDPVLFPDLHARHLVKPALRQALQSLSIHQYGTYTRDKHYAHKNLSETTVPVENAEAAPVLQCLIENTGKASSCQFDFFLTLHGESGCD